MKELKSDSIKIEESKLNAWRTNSTSLISQINMTKHMLSSESQGQKRFRIFGMMKYLKNHFID
ncbi:unnamed protein product [Timema podura]|uniref:Uncharacterized protein n=1 Tax=Timema podura TaxID=61482 RepID=A0ABN7P1F2_TIMPD|nr:unnamed protein product [Timema podura]